MANTIVVNDSVIMTNQGVAGDQLIVNVWGGRFEDPLPDQVNFPSNGHVMVRVNTAFRQYMRAEIIPLLSNVLTMQNYKTQLLKFPPTSPVTQWQFVAEHQLPGFEAADVGGNIGEPEHSFTAFSVRLITDTPGRIGRGGKRLGPYIETNDDFNAIVELDRVTVQDSVIDFTEQMAADLDDDFGFQVAVNSFKTYAMNLGTQFSWPVLTAICNRFVGSQLSRKSYLRGH